MNTLEAIKNRTSVREYSDKLVSEKDIETILKAAMAAPSAINKQPWEFYVLKSKESQDALKDVLVHGRFNSPLIIVVAINQERTTQGISHGLGYCDAGAATENILLAAKDLGLDSVWCAIWPDDGRINGVRKALKIPYTIEPFAAIHIGYAKSETTPKDKWDESKVHTL